MWHCEMAVPKGEGISSVLCPIFSSQTRRTRHPSAWLPREMHECLMSRNLPVLDLLGGSLSSVRENERQEKICWRTSPILLTEVSSSQQRGRQYERNCSASERLRT